MSLPFYDVSVATHLQTLGGVANVLEKGEAFAAENDIDLDELVRYRFRDDMAPFSFQVISVWHHSMGAMKAFQSGLFEPPPKMSDMTWEKTKALIPEAIEYLSSLDRDMVNELSGKDMVFRIGGRDLPFKNNDFLMSFSLPNFFFHSTTTYMVMRMQGVPLGKMDYIGQMRMNAG